MDDKNLRLEKEDIKRRSEFEAKAANAHFKPGSIHSGRYVDPYDYQRWEQQRLERKQKKHTLNPYR